MTNATGYFMRVSSMIQFTFFILSFFISADCFSQDDLSRVIYFASGSSKVNSPSNNSSPMSLGFIGFWDSSTTVVGLDFSAEGTSQDSYNGSPSTQQSNSYNLIIGRNLVRFADSRFDASIILGGRSISNSTTCPKSYLGYQCYADTKPETSTSYAFNYGGMLTYTFKSVMVGVRATGQSTQALLGYRF